MIESADLFSYSLKWIQHHKGQSLCVFPGKGLTICAAVMEGKYAEMADQAAEVKEVSA